MSDEKRHEPNKGPKYLKDDEEAKKQEIDNEIDHPTIIKIKVPLRRRLDFLVRLNQDHLAQREFFYLIIREYINNRKSIREIVDRYKSLKNKAPQSEITFSREQFKQASEKEALFTSDELSEIFSVLSEEDF